MGVRVLVAEDHVTLAGRIAQGLRQAGMAVDAVYDGAAVLEAAAQAAYDVIVLDRDLPACTATGCAAPWQAAGRGSSCSPPPPSMTGSTGWNLARMTTLASRSRSPSCRPGAGAIAARAVRAAGAAPW